MRPHTLLVVATCLMVGIVVPDHARAEDSAPALPLYGPVASPEPDRAIAAPAAPEAITAGVDPAAQPTPEVQGEGAAGPGIPSNAPSRPEPLTLRERALNQFRALGATQWQIDVFDCIGWQESKWLNSRSRTGDDGTLQINDIHDPELRARGLDPYVPEDAATFAWSLSREGTRFTPWTVHAKCGV